jgi:BirA family transcriptional regulator, biotin operon repressor / biotin---[acetyl-CoA-carboxylase] ligase
MPLSSSKFIILESVDSTNNYAMAMVKNGVANNESAVFSIEQRAGKGRRGKTWVSEKGENILLTVLKQMLWLPVHQQFLVSIATALAAHDFCSQYIKENVKIKWPNDIYIDDRKAGGILIENVIKGNLWQWAIIGIGLNINQQNFEKENLTATSLKQLTAEHYDVIQLSRDLHEMILKRLRVLQSGHSGKMLEEYNDNLFCLNKTVRLKKGDSIFESKIERVSADGELVTKDIAERRFRFDEVQWIST